MLREEAGEDVEIEYLTYAVSMVAEWDFVDDETNKPIPIVAGSIDELSMEQVNELSALFNQNFGEMSEVKKTTDGPSHSISTMSSPGVSLEPGQSGYKSLYSPEDSE